MKKLLLSCALLTLVLFSCSTDSTDQSSEQDTSVNLVTFVPDATFDTSFKGKYVGYFGHHANRKLQGKIYINAGQHGQYDALVNFKRGGSFKFAGTPLSSDGAMINFTGETGSFVLDLHDFESNIEAMVSLIDEDTEGYFVVRKATSSRMPQTFLGTYVDGTNPAFTGDWNLMTDGTDVVNTAPVLFPGFPIPLNVTVTTQNLSALSITHNGIPTPFTDSSFETNTATDCFDDLIPGLPIPTTPVAITAPISVEIFGDAGGVGSLSAGGQSSLLNGSTTTWNMTYNSEAGIPGLGLTFPAGFYNEDCSAGTSGSWSRNGRSGTVSF